MKTNPPSRLAANGSALIITLFFMGMITVVIVGVLISSRLERSVAHSHFDQKRASDFAREGVERVVATLGKQTTFRYSFSDPITGEVTYRYRNYLTQPGGLIVPSATPSGNPTTDVNSQNVLKTFVPLTSGTPSPTGGSSSDPVYAATSLNVPSFIQQAYPTYTVDDRIAKQTSTGTGGAPTKPSAMKLRWVYVHQDPKAAAGKPGTFDDPVDQAVTPDTRANDSKTMDTPKIDAQYPIIGRFAYWTDDESTKINYNMAWKKSLATATTSNASILVDPSHVSLKALFRPPVDPTADPSKNPSYLSDGQADMIHQWGTPTIGTKASPAPSPFPGRYFNSFEDARQLGQVDTTIPAIIDYNNFELTHYNHDPDTTFFGDDRILLTTNPRLVPKNPDGSYARKFLDILREDKVPPGGDFRNVDPPDPGYANNLAANELDYNGSTVPSSSKYYSTPVPNKFDMVVKNLVRYINQTNWPVMLGNTNASFKLKYYNGYATDSATDGAAVGQLAVAIIDYVRSRESALQVVGYTRFAFSGGAYTTLYSLVGAKTSAFQGSCRTLLCTEMGVMCEKSTSSGVTECADGTYNGWPADNANLPTKRKKLYRYWLKYEFYLPTRYSVGSDASGNPLGIDLLASSNPTTQETWDVPIILGAPANTTYVQGYDKMLYPFNEGGGQVIPLVKGSSPVVTVYHGDGTTGGSIVKPGEYVTVIVPYYRTTPFGNGNVGIRSGLGRAMFSADGKPIADQYSIGAQIVPQSTAATIPAALVSQYSGTNAPVLDPTTLDIQSVETDDPRCNLAALDWHIASSLGGTTNKNSWGYQNNVWTADGVRNLPTSNPSGNFSSNLPQDKNSSGKVSSISLYMPPPRDPASTNPQNGRVTSVGELGYVTTGLYANGSSINWRTMHLQPSGPLSNSYVPDWALMDLFAAPNLPLDPKSTTTPPNSITGRDMYDPHGNTVGGRVNLNSVISPFDDVNRDRALAALFHDSHDPAQSTFDPKTGQTGSLSPFPDQTAETMAQNVILQTLAATTSPSGKGAKFGTMGTTFTGMPPNTFVYDSPGEICEIKGIADGGEASEDLVREIASLSCTRGGVFSVYTVGQAIQQSPTGKLSVTAEQRQQSMVERYVANRNTANTGDDQVRFRTVYTRNLTP